MLLAFLSCARGQLRGAPLAHHMRDLNRSGNGGGHNQGTQGNVTFPPSVWGTVPEWPPEEKVLTTIAVVEKLPTIAPTYPQAKKEQI